jgi:SP family xylose:H+ symportor-like MFS transporter
VSQSTPTVPAAANHTGLLITLTIIAALGGLLFGYDSAVISGATESIKMNFVAQMGLAEEARLSLEGFTIAGALWGCLIGGAIGGVVAHYIGRRGGLIVAGVLFFVSSLGSAWPESTIGHLGSLLTPLINALLWFLNLFFQDAPYVHFGDNITNFIGHRLFGGMGIGLASMLAPMYIAEIAPPSKRGSLVTYQQIAIVSGITISYFVNYFIKKYGGAGDANWVNTEGWRWMLACCAVPAGIFVLLLFFVPETPRGLMLKGKTEKANAVLRRLASDEKPGSSSRKSMPRSRRPRVTCCRTAA